MKIAFVHYHLKTGGVTTVLQQQQAAIRDCCKTLVLTGTPPESDFPFTTHVIDALAYDSFRTQPVVDPEAAADEILNAIHDNFGSPADIIHVHNPTLSKNIHLLSILSVLQKKGTKLLLQCHDFAEDGRPNVFYRQPYPTDCHYGVINSRDYDMLIRAGLTSNGLHRLTNSVKQFDTPTVMPEIANRVLYPIRAIRRKNIGEAILLSLYFPNRETLAITLPPNSPVDIAAYESWKSFVCDRQLNVEFDVGLKGDFLELMLTSRFILTTSITEGFGFSFLEPWLADKLLWGRRLPDICRDFEQQGIRLNHLYDHLFVPTDWFDANTYRKIWCSCVENIASLYDIDLPDQQILAAADNLAAGDFIDFGLLNEHFQKQIISRVLTDSDARRHLVKLNPYLSAPAVVDDPTGLVAHNHRQIKRQYSLENYRQMLLTTYRRVIRSTVKQQIDKKALVKGFMTLKQFSLLKWCQDVG